MTSGCMSCNEGLVSAEGAAICTTCTPGSAANAEGTTCVSCTGLADTGSLQTDTNFPVAPGTEVAVYCIAGSILAGDDTITCVSGSIFDYSSQETSSCVQQTCATLPAILNLAPVTNLPVSHGTKVTVQCNAGFTLGGDSVLICVKDTDYTYKTAPSCTPMTCTGLPADASNLKTSATFPVDHAAVIDVSCDESSNVELRGDTTLTCVQGMEIITVCP